MSASRLNEGQVLDLIIKDSTIVPSSVCDDTQDISFDQIQLGNTVVEEEKT